MTQGVKERDHLIISPSDYAKSLRRDSLRRGGGGIKTCEWKAALLLFVCFAPQKCTSKTPVCTRIKINEAFLFSVWFTVLGEFASKRSRNVFD